MELSTSCTYVHACLWLCFETCPIQSSTCLIWASTCLIQSPTCQLRSSTCCRAGSEATYSCCIELGVSTYVCIYIYIYIYIALGKRPPAPPYHTVQVTILRATTTTTTTTAQITMHAFSICATALGKKNRPVQVTVGLAQHQHPSDHRMCQGVHAHS